jgi:hypothetical protein
MAAVLTRRNKQHKDPGRSMVASSADVTKMLTKSSWDMPARRRAWQLEIYRLLEIVGELRSAAKLVGTGVSKSRLYIADLDPDGEIRGETTNRRAQRICNRILGGGDRREDEMRLAGMNLFLVGEAFLWGRTEPDVRERERWHTLSVSSFSRPAGKLTVDLDGQKPQEVLPGDILRRMWMPHPEKRGHPDSAPRSCRVVLQELEQLTKFVLTQVDSRLISAGLLPWPNGTMTGGTENTIGTSIMKQLMELAAASNDGTGTSAAAVPLIIDVPPDALGKIQLVTFQSELSRIAGELRTEAVKRLALGLDISPEQLLGSGETNHWTVWYIDESSVRVHVEPILRIVCEALNSSWVEPALEKAGLDPTKFQLTYDTSNLTIRPQRLQETLSLYERGIVSAQAVRDAGAYLPGDAPSQEEDVQRYTRELGLRSPQLIDQQRMLKPMGLDGFVDPVPEQMTPEAAPTPPPPEVTAVESGVGAIPNTQGTPGGQQPGAVTASSTPRRWGSEATVLADACVQRTMELAGGRLLTHTNRGAHRDVARSELHTRIWVDPDRLASLTAGGPEHTLALATRNNIPDPRGFANLVHLYCETLLRHGVAHDPRALSAFLATEGGHHAP